MWDNVSKDQFALLAQRCVQGATLKIIQYSAIQYFTLTTIAVFYNLAPFFTLFFAYLFLNETIKNLDIYGCILGFFSVICITLGMKKEENGPKHRISSKDFAQVDHFSILAFSLICLAPVCKAGQNVLLRVMRKMKAETVSCYINPFTALVSFLGMVIFGIDTSYIYVILTSRAKTVVIFVFIGCVNVMQQMLKFKANQHEQASKLAVFGYLQTPYQLVLDVLVVGSILSSYQIIGVSIMFCVFSLKIYDYR